MCLCFVCACVLYVSMFCTCRFFLHSLYPNSPSPPLSVRLSRNLSDCLKLSPSVTFFLYLSVCLSIHLSVCFSASICLSLSLSVCLSVYLSVYVSLTTEDCDIFSKSSSSSDDGICAGGIINCLPVFFWSHQLEWVRKKSATTASVHTSPSGRSIIS